MSLRAGWDAVRSERASHWLAALVACAIMGTIIAGDRVAVNRVAVVLAFAALSIAVAALTNSWSRWWLGALLLCLGGLPVIAVAQRLFGRADVNQNAFGGTLLFFIPLTLAGALPGTSGRPAQFGSAALFAIYCAALYNSRSWTAWAALPVPIVMVLRARWPASGIVRSTERIVIVATIAAWCWLWLIVPPWGVAPWPDALFGSLWSRFELWWRALVMISDMPLTGVGLNGFRHVVDSYLPATTITNVDVAHAHNIWLQVALDTGLVGLVAYGGFLLSLFRLAERRWQLPADQRIAVTGITAGLIGVHAFGIADAIALGALASVFFWWGAGLLLALAALPPTDSR